MMNWLQNDFWLKNPMPWFMPRQQRIFISNDNSPTNSFFETTAPVVFDPFIPRFTAQDLLNLHLQHNPAFRAQAPAKQLNKPSKTFSREYNVSTCLGKGGYGQAFSGRRKQDNKTVAIKFLPKNRILNWGIYDGRRVPYEIELLCRLRNKTGIIKILEYFEEPERFIFSMEKIPNSCTLFNFVVEGPSLANTELLRHIYREIIRINVMLQNNGIWHRDCKPENILYCKDDRSLRLIDFGSAAPVQSEDFHEFQGTLEIMAPEWILQERYNGEKSCVWTLGVCLYFLLFQQYPFRSKADIVQVRPQLPFASTPDNEAYRTMRDCLNIDEDRRPRLTDLQYLSWLQ